VSQKPLGGPDRKAIADKSRNSQERSGREEYLRVDCYSLSRLVE